jgi:hypothetical protein
MGRSNRWLDRWLVPLVLGVIGIPFAIAGGIILAVVPGSFDRTINRVRDLRLSTVQSLKEVGAEVMLEGVISDRTPPAYDSLVAYRLYEPVTEDGETTWEVRSRASPPLWLTLPDGEVTIQAGYHLGNVPHTLKTASDREYTGIQVGDPVLVLGTLGAKAVGDAPPQIQAETVTVETVDGYLASLTTNKRIFQGMGAGFLVAGTGLLLGSTVSVGYTLRQG